MKIQDTYLKFLQKVNKNRTNDNISVDKDRFVYLFNEAQNKYYQWGLEKRNEDDRRFIQELLTLDKKLTFSAAKDTHSNYSIPEDYFDFSNLRIVVKKDKCKAERFLVWEVKDEDVSELLTDLNNRPSFKHRETFYTIAGNNINVYTGDFEILGVYLNYYRKPIQVDIEGYIDIDGNSSNNIDPEWSDRVVERILDIATKEFNLNSGSLESYQFDKDRINTDY